MVSSSECPSADLVTLAYQIQKVNLYGSLFLLPLFSLMSVSLPFFPLFSISSCVSTAPFLADRTIGRAYGTVCRLSSVCNVLYCGKMMRPSQKVSEGVNRKPGSKSSFFQSPPYFYFRFRHYGHCDGRFCLIFARTAQQLILDGTN